MKYWFSPSDFKSAAKCLKRNPRYSLTVIGLLTIGLGLPLAIMSLAKTLLSPPVDHPERLVWVRDRVNGAANGASMWQLRRLLERGKSFEAVGGYLRLDYGPQNFYLSGTRRSVRVMQASGGLFEALRLRPVIGRGFLPTDPQWGPGAPVLLSWELWQSAFDGNHDIIGKDILINNASFTVVGVMGTDAGFPEKVDLWLPLATRGNWALTEHSVQILGRVRQGVSLDQVQTELTILNNQLKAEYPAYTKDVVEIWEPFLPGLLGTLASMTKLATLTSLLVFLVACVSLLILGLLKANERRSELAIRNALGATPLHLGRQLFAESLLLSVLGGVGGIAIAWLAVFSGGRLLAQLLPPYAQFHVNSSILLIASSLVVGSVLLYGVYPAFRFATVDPLGSMGSVSRSTTASKRFHSVVTVLLAAEIAGVTALVVTALVSVNSFRALEAFPFGFNVSGVLETTVHVPNLKNYTDVQTASNIEDALSKISRPGIESAAASFDLPLNLSAGQFDAHTGSSPALHHFVGKAVTPNYFRTLQIPIVAGQDFEKSDLLLHGLEPIVINESSARAMWPDTAPVGQSFYVLNTTEPAIVKAEVKDVNYFGRDVPALYYPFTGAIDAHPAVTTFHVYTRGQQSVPNVQRVIQQELTSLFPQSEVELPVMLEEKIIPGFNIARFQTILSVVFAVASVIVGISGVYVIIAFVVQQRLRELALRMLLGATVFDAEFRLLQRLILIGGTSILIGAMASSWFTTLFKGAFHELQVKSYFSTIAAGIGILLLILLTALSAMRPLRTVSLSEIIRE